MQHVGGRRAHWVTSRPGVNPHWPNTLFRRGVSDWKESE
jgi:hypothetical protein